MSGFGASIARPCFGTTDKLTYLPTCMLVCATKLQANSVNGPTWPGQPLEHVALASLIASSTATDGGISTISLSTLVFAEGLLWACADQVGCDGASIGCVGSRALRRLPCAQAYNNYLIRQ